MKTLSALLLGVLCVSVALSGQASVTSLNTAYRLSLSNNYNYKESYEQMRAEMEKANRAITDVLPHVALTGTHVKGRYEFDSSVTTDVSYESYGASVTQTLFNFPEFIALRLSSIAKAGLRYRYAAAREHLTKTVVKRYMSVSLAERLIQAADVELALTKKALIVSEKAYKLNERTQDQVLEAKANYRRALSDHAQAIAMHEDALDLLSATINQPVHRVNGFSTQFSPKAAPGSVRQLQLKAIFHNLGVQALLQEVAVKRGAIAAVATSRLPSVTAVASYNKSSSQNMAGYNSGIPYIGNVSEPFSTHASGYTSGVEISMPVFEGGRIYTETQHEEARYSKSYYQLLDMRALLQVKTKEDFLNLKVLAERYEANRLAAQSDRLAIKYMMQQVALGQKTEMDLLQLIAEYYDELRIMARTQYDYVNTYVELQEDIGALNGKTITTIASWMSGSSHDTMPSYRVLYKSAKALSLESYLLQPRKGEYIVQLASTTSRSELFRLMLAYRNLPGLHYYSLGSASSPTLLYRVYVGPYQTEREASVMLKSIKKKHHQGFTLQVE